MMLWFLDLEPGVLPWGNCLLWLIQLELNWTELSFFSISWLFPFIFIPRVVVFFNLVLFIVLVYFVFPECIHVFLMFFCLCSFIHLCPVKCNSSMLSPLFLVAYLGFALYLVLIFLWTSLYSFSGFCSWSVIYHTFPVLYMSCQVLVVSNFVSIYCLFYFVIFSIVLFC